MARRFKINGRYVKGTNFLPLLLAMHFIVFMLCVVVLFLYFADMIPYDIDTLFKSYVDYIDNIIHLKG